MDPNSFCNVEYHLEKASLAVEGEERQRREMQMTSRFAKNFQYLKQREGP